MNYMDTKERAALQQLIDAAQQAEAALRISGYKITADALSVAIHNTRNAFKEVA